MSLNREIVSFRFVRSCVRARGLDVEWKFDQNVVLHVFPFPFWPRVVFPFSLESSHLPPTSYPTLVGLIGKI